MAASRSQPTENRLIDMMSCLFPDKPVTLHELKHPTKDFVMDWYISFLAHFNINAEPLFQLSNRDADLYGEAVPLARLALILRDIYNKIFFNDVAPFGLMDILKPSMINFMAYSANKMVDINKYLEELDQKKVHAENLLQEREKLLANLNEKANIRAKIDDLEQEISDKQKELHIEMSEVADVEKRTAEKENTIKKLELKLKQLNNDLFEATQKQASIEALVMNSPQSVKLQETQLMQKLADMEEEVVSAQNMLTSKRELVKALENATEDLQSKRLPVEKLVADWKLMNEERDRAAELRKTHSKLSEEVTKENSEILNLNVTEKQLRDTLSGLQLRRENKERDFQSRLTALKRQIRDISEQKNDQYRRLQNEVKTMTGEISCFVKANEILNRKCADLYASLLSGEQQLGENIAHEVEGAVLKLKKWREGQN